MYTIEDYIELLAGIQGTHKFDIQKPDFNLLTSFARQTFKGIAFTDRQYQLAKTKVQEYQDQLENIGINVTYVDNLRMPLRTIDRSKTVKLFDKFPAEENKVYESWKDLYNWIEVRFPFSKKDIVKIEEIKSSLGSMLFYHHERGSHKHYFAHRKNVAYLIVEKFSTYNIDEEIVEQAKAQKEIIVNSNDYLPRYNSKGLQNVPDDLEKTIVDELGKDATVLQYVDRSSRYNLDIDVVPVSNTLTETIAFRNQSDLCLDPKKYRLDDIVKSLYDLDRFPLLVLIDEQNSYVETKEFYESVRYLIPAEQQSVLFRAEGKNTENVHINQYIKDNKLNNWVDNSTKIVYIKKSKIPKVLFGSNFTPVASFCKSSNRLTTMVDNYVKFRCDLNIFHDEHESLYSKYRRY